MVRGRKGYSGAQFREARCDYSINGDIEFGVGESGGGDQQVVMGRKKTGPWGVFEILWFRRKTGMYTSVRRGRRQREVEGGGKGGRGDSKGAQLHLQWLK